MTDILIILGINRILYKFIIKIIHLRGGLETFGPTFSLSAELSTIQKLLVMPLNQVNPFFYVFYYFIETFINVS